MFFFSGAVILLAPSVSEVTEGQEFTVCASFTLVAALERDVTLSLYITESSQGAAVYIQFK